MRDPRRGRDALRAATPLRAGAALVLPIERVALRAERGASWLWGSAVVEPFALVVRDAGAVRVVGVGATAVSLERLREAIPALDALLASA